MATRIEWTATPALAPVKKSEWAPEAPQEKNLEKPWHRTETTGSKWKGALPWVLLMNVPRTLSEDNLGHASVANTRQPLAT